MAELDFVKDLPDDYSCMICVKVLNEPHLTDCCGQHFCQLCLERWFERQGKKICPHCRSESFSHMRYLPLKRKVDSLQVYCTFKKNGCDKITTVGELNSHADNCGFAPVACTQNCGEMILRKDLAQHCSSVCWQRKIKCKYCGEKDLFAVIIGIHTLVCQEYPVECPKECTQDDLKRKDLPQHTTVCPLEPVDCDFHDAGCNAIVLRKALASHLESNTQLHLRKMMAFCRKQGEEHKSLMEEHKNLREDHKNLREEHKKLKKECECLSSQVQMLTLTEPIKLDKHWSSFTFHIPSSKGWISPPFYVLDGYKFCIKHKEGDTASLLLLKGERDDRLRWPVDRRCKIVIIFSDDKEQINKQLAQFQLYNSTVDLGRVAAANQSRELLTMTLPQNAFENGRIMVEFHDVGANVLLSKPQKQEYAQHVFLCHHCGKTTTGRCLRFCPHCGIDVGHFSGARM